MNPQNPDFVNNLLKSVPTGSKLFLDSYSLGIWSGSRWQINLSWIAGAKRVVKALSTTIRQCGTMQVGVPSDPPGVCDQSS